MYYIYKSEPRIEGQHFHSPKDISLFGCNIGLMANYLKKQQWSKNPDWHEWHWPIGKELEKSSDAFIIDIKPNKGAADATLFQLLDVWGTATNAWCPLLLRMNGLSVDGVPSIGDSKEEFTITPSDDNKSVYTILYAMGGIENGELVGTWNAASPSSTNSALLWPDTLRYFFRSIQLATPEILNATQIL